MAHRSIRPPSDEAWTDISQRANSGPSSEGTLVEFDEEMAAAEHGAAARGGSMRAFGANEME